MASYVVQAAETGTAADGPQTAIPDVLEVQCQPHLGCRAASEIPARFCSRLIQRIFAGRAFARRSFSVSSCRDITCPVFNTL